MSYEYDIFVSYRRTPTVGGSVLNHLRPRVEAKLNERAPASVRVIVDDTLAEGVSLPAALKRRILRSGREDFSGLKREAVEDQVAPVLAVCHPH